MKKVLLISHEVPPRPSGASFVLGRLFKHFPKDAYAIYSTYAKRISGAEAAKLPCRYYSAPGHAIGDGFRRWYLIREWLEVLPMVWQGLKVIKKERIGSLLICPWKGNLFLAAFILHKITRIPLSIYFFDCYTAAQTYLPRKYIAKLLEKAAVKSANNVFVMSEALQGYYAAKYNCHPILIPHPIDLSAYAKIGVDNTEKKPKDKTIIVFTGMIYEAQLDALLDLCVALKDLSRAELHIYSPRPVAHLISAGITGKNVVHHGQVDPKDIPQIQINADFLFLPLAFNSPYPNIIKTASPSKLPEYLASGRPIIVHAPADSYVAWYARKHGWGYVVDEPDPQRLKDAILKLIDDKETQEYLIDNARKTVVFHSSERTAGKLMKMLGVADQKKDFAHFVLTGFNANIYPASEYRLQESWLEHRFRLFSQFAYPSLKGQTCQDFKWIVIFDINTPEPYKSRIAKYAKWRNFIPVFQDKYELPRKIILDNISGNPRYLITSRVDNDDALSKHYIQTVQDYFDRQDFTFINLTNGYVFGNDELYLDEQPSNSFATLIEKFENFKTVWFPECHTKLANYGPVREISTSPAWLQVVHGKNISNKIRGELLHPIKILSLKNDFRLQKNLFLSYLAGMAFYSARGAFDATRKLRHVLGLRNSRLEYLWDKLLRAKR